MLEMVPIIVINTLSVVIALMVIVRLNRLGKTMIESLSTAMLTGASLLIGGISICDQIPWRNYGYWPEVIIGLAILVVNCVRLFGLPKGSGIIRYRSAFTIKRI